MSAAARRIREANREMSRAFWATAGSLYVHTTNAVSPII